MSTHKHTTGTPQKKKGVSARTTKHSRRHDIRYCFSYHQCFHRFRPTVSNTTMHQGSPLQKSNVKKKSRRDQCNPIIKTKQRRFIPLPSLNNVPVLDNFFPFMYNCKRPNCASSLIMVNSCKHNNNNRGTCGKSTINHQTQKTQEKTSRHTTNMFSTTTNQNGEPCT